MGIESISICNQEVAERNSMGLTGASPVWIVSHHEAGRARSRRRRALSSIRRYVRIEGTWMSRQVL